MPQSIFEDAYRELEDMGLIKRAIVDGKEVVWLTEIGRDAELDEEAERRAAPVCRICGEEGHSWQRCGND